MVTHFSILAWRIPQTEEAGGLWAAGWQRVGHTEVPLHTCWCLLLPVGFSLAAASGGYSLVVVHQVLLVVASLLQRRGSRAHKLQQLWCKGSVAAACGFQSTGSTTVGQRLNCSMPGEIFLQHGSNPYLLHWQVASSPLNHQGSPYILWNCSQQ